MQRHRSGSLVPGSETGDMGKGRVWRGWGTERVSWQGFQNKDPLPRWQQGENLAGERQKPRCEDGAPREEKDERGTESPVSVRETPPVSQVRPVRGAGH